MSRHCCCKYSIHKRILINNSKINSIKSNSVLFPITYDLVWIIQICSCLEQKKKTTKSKFQTAMSLWQMILYVCFWIFFMSLSIFFSLSPNISAISKLLYPVFRTLSMCLQQYEMTLIVSIVCGGLFEITIFERGLWFLW